MENKKQNPTCVRRTFSDELKEMIERRKEERALIASEVEQLKHYLRYWFSTRHRESISITVSDELDVADYSAEKGESVHFIAAKCTLSSLRAWFANEGFIVGEMRPYDSFFIRLYEEDPDE